MVQVLVHDMYLVPVTLSLHWIGCSMAHANLCVQGASSLQLFLVFQVNQACSAVQNSCPAGYHYDISNADEKCTAQLCDAGATGNKLQKDDLAKCCKA